MSLKKDQFCVCMQRVNLLKDGNSSSLYTKTGEIASSVHITAAPHMSLQFPEGFVITKYF